MADLKRVTLTLAAAGLLSSGLGQAALFDRGGGLIYDDVLDITWMSDANYSLTSAYDDDGRMTQSAATTWAANLNYGGYDDWRLPTALNQDSTGPCFGYGCSGSELGHMFYNNMGATAGNNILSGANTANLALITNLQTEAYRTSTPYDDRGAYFLFQTFDGYQTLFPGGFFHAWAVRDGDVAAIPEPETYAMLLAGLGLLGWHARRREQTEGRALHTLNYVM